MIYQILDSNIPYLVEKINTVIYSEIGYFERKIHDAYSYFRYGDFYKIEDLPPDIQVDLESRVDFNRLVVNNAENNVDNNANNNANKNANNNVNIEENKENHDNNTISTVNTHVNILQSNRKNNRIDAERINISNNSRQNSVEVIPNQVGAGEGNKKKVEADKEDKVEKVGSFRNSATNLPTINSAFNNLNVSESKLFNSPKQISNKDLSEFFKKEANLSKQKLNNSSNSSLFKSSPINKMKIEKQKSIFSPNQQKQNYVNPDAHTESYFKAIMNETKKSKFKRKVSHDDLSSDNNSRLESHNNKKINEFNDKNIIDSDNEPKLSENSSDYDSSIQISSFVYSEESIDQEANTNKTKNKPQKPRKSCIKIVEARENDYNLRSINNNIDNESSQQSTKKMIPKRGVSIGPLANILGKQDERKIDYQSIKKQKTNRKSNNFFTDDSIVEYNQHKLYEKDDISNYDSDSFDNSSKANFPISINNNLSFKNSKTGITKQSSFRRSNSSDNVNSTDHNQYKHDFYGDKRNVFDYGAQLRGLPENHLNIIGADGIERIIEPEKHSEDAEVDAGKNKADLEEDFDVYNKDATILDFEELPIELRLKLDRRTFWKYLKDLIFNEHQILSIFLKKSLFYPPYIRIIKTFTYLFCYITIGTMLYSDDDISAKNKLDIQPAVINFKLLLNKLFYI